MSTAVEICNLGLQMIGEPPITSLSGTDIVSLRVNRVYNQCRDLALQAESRGWGFATRRKQLKAVTADANGLAYFPAYAMWVMVGNQGVIFTSVDNGTTWERQNSGTGQDLHGVCVVTLGSTSTIVTVGKKGTILTSTDGVVWTARTSGVYTNLYGVGGYTDFLVACGADGVLLSSTDAATWTSRTSGTYRALRAVSVYSTTPVWIVVGDGGVILTSTNLTSWTSQTSGVSTDLNGVVYGSSLYVAVGDSGVILTSTDYTAWTSRTSGVTTALYGIAYADSVYKAVGADGVLLGSSNGTTWAATSNDAEDDLLCISYNRSEDSWCMAGAESELHTSTDGSTWTEVEVEPAFGYDYCFALPGDYLQFLGVSLDEDGLYDEGSFEYAIESETLLTDEDEVYLRYGARITDTAKYPAWFVNLLAVDIAIAVQPVQAKSPSLAAQLKDDRKTALRDARSYNNREAYVKDEKGLPLWTEEGR